MILDDLLALFEAHGVPQGGPEVGVGFATFVVVYDGAAEVHVA